MVRIRPPLPDSTTPSDERSRAAALAALADVVRDGADRDALIPSGSAVVLAVSGGPDSMALLAGAAAVADARAWRLAVAHLDHRLRPTSGDDATFVRDAAAARGIPFHCDAVDVATLARRDRRSLEEAGRVARYAFLERIADSLGGALIATAHTADDSAETILLNLARGSGLAGLRGIPARRGRVVRPFLAERRARLHELVTAAGVEYRTDETNLEPHFSRARVRLELIPALERLNAGAVEALLRLSRLATDDDAALIAIAHDELARRTVSGEAAGAKIRVNWRDPPERAIGRRVIRLAVGDPAPSMERIEAVLRAAEGTRGGVAVDLGGRRRATIRGRVIAFELGEA